MADSVLRGSRAFASAPLPWWHGITAEPLTDDERRLVETVNRLSERPESDHAWLEPVYYERVTEALDLPEAHDDEGYSMLHRIGHRMKGYPRRGLFDAYLP